MDKEAAAHRVEEMIGEMFDMFDVERVPELTKHIAEIVTIAIVNATAAGHESGELCGARQVADNCAEVLKQYCPTITTDEEAVEAMNAFVPDSDRVVN